MNIKAMLAAVSTLLVSNLGMISAHAAQGSATGVPQNVYTYGDGRVLVTGLTFVGASCSNNGGFVIYGEHPHLSKMLALILSAKASGTSIEVSAKVDDCWYPWITQDTQSYVIALTDD